MSVAILSKFLVIIIITWCLNHQGPPDDLLFANIAAVINAVLKAISRGYTRV